MDPAQLGLQRAVRTRGREGGSCVAFAAALQWCMLLEPRCAALGLLLGRTLRELSVDNKPCNALVPATECGQMRSGLTMA